MPDYHPIIYRHVNVSLQLVQINGEARIKLSEDINKVTIPGCKNVYRLYGQDGHALVDLMTRVDEPAPKVGQRVLSRHPFEVGVAMVNLAFLAL